MIENEYQFELHFSANPNYRILITFSKGRYDFAFDPESLEKPTSLLDSGELYEPGTLDRTSQELLLSLVSLHTQPPSTSTGYIPQRSNIADALVDFLSIKTDFLSLSNITIKIHLAGRNGYIDAGQILTNRKDW